jgi:hypothetical protein
MDPFFGLLVFVITLFASFPLLRKLLKNYDILTVILASFTLGLSSIIVPLLIVGVTSTNGFGFASWIIFLTSLVLFISTCVLYLTPFKGGGSIRFSLVFKRFSIVDYAFMAVIVFLVFKYVYILLLKGIFDWDAIDQFLTFGRRISVLNYIPLANYDYQPNVYPPGISILYAWLHSLGGSPYDESFRLLPLLSVIMTILLVYKIASTFSTTRIAKIAVIIYALLPLHDSVLFYSSYYADPIFNVLVLATFFFAFSYLRKFDVKYCFFGGLSLGLAALFKPQFLLVLPATIFIFITLIRNRKLQIVSTVAFSALLALFYIFLVWGNPNFFFDMSLETKVISVIFVLAITAALVYSITKTKNPFSSVYTLRKSVQDVVIFYVTSGSVCIFWYLRNLVLTGSILWSVSFKDTNFQWALNFLKFASVSTPQGDIIQYVLLLIVLPFVIFVLGTLWLFAKFTGLIIYLRHKFLVLFVWIAGYWISYFWWNLYHFEVYSLNPRDLFFFSPFFSIFTAFGILAIIDFSVRQNKDAVVIYLVSAFGFLSLAQSMLINNYGPAFIKNWFVSLTRTFGGSTDILSGQIANNVLSLFSSIPSLLLFTTIISFIILTPLLLKFAIHLIKPTLSIRIKLNYHFKVPLRVALVFILMFMILVAPYIWLTYEFSGGNAQNFGDAQLSPIYNGLFTEVAPYINNNINSNEVILTFSPEFRSLQYYIKENASVVALNIPGNLAAFRAAVEANSSSSVMSTLEQLNVRYFLEKKGGMSPFISKLSNESLLIEVFHDPHYFTLVKSFEDWNLYESIAKKYSIVYGWEDNSFDANWKYAKDYSTLNANWSFNTDGDVLNLSVSGNASVCFQDTMMPNLNMSEYNYVVARVRGSPNTQWLFRLFSKDGLSYDYPYWGSPSEQWQTMLFSIADTPLQGKTLDQSMLVIRSTNNDSATLYVDFYAVFKYVVQ